MRRGQQREAVAGLEQQLHAQVAVVVAAHRVLARGAGAIGAGAVVGVVHPVIAVLVQGRDAERGHIVDRRAEAAVDRHGAVAAVAGADPAAAVLAGLDAVELDDAGGGVAAEQRALRAAQHFHLVDVVDRVGLQHHVLEHDVVLDDRHRLRRAEVEVDVAQAADVEAREDAAGGGLGVEARHAAGQRQQGVVAAGGVVAHRLALDHADRHRHVLQVLLAALGSHGDGVERGDGVGARGGILRGGGAGQRRQQQAGTGHRQRMTARQGGRGTGTRKLGVRHGKSFPGTGMRFRAAARGRRCGRGLLRGARTLRNRCCRAMARTADSATACVDGPHRCRSAHRLRRRIGRCRP